MPLLFDNLLTKNMNAADMFLLPALGSATGQKIKPKTNIGSKIMSGTDGMLLPTTKRIETEGGIYNCIICALSRFFAVDDFCDFKFCAPSRQIRTERCGAKTS